MDYGAQSMNVFDTPIVDQTLDMSPMDLFDSIFWGEFYRLRPGILLTNPRSVSNEQFGSAGLRLFTAALYGILGQDPHLMRRRTIYSRAKITNGMTLTLGFVEP